METERVLNEFGSLVVTEVFDTGYGSAVEVLNGTCPNLKKKELKDIFNKLNEEEKNKLIYIYI